jgi:hypothetical protein
MAALTSVQKLNIQGGVKDIGSVPVLASTKIFKGGMIGITAAGYARPFVTTDQFAGHALETVDNSNGASGALRVDRLRGRYTLTVPAFDSVTVANFSDDVGAASDNHADLTQTSTDKVGVISDVNENGVAVTFQTADAE